MGINSTRKVHVPADASDTFSGSIVSAEWNGGAYVDLFFGGHTAPVEVINIYDYTGATWDRRVQTPAGLRQIVREWISDTEAEWPEWYGVYLENSTL